MKKNLQDLEQTILKNPALTKEYIECRIAFNNATFIKGIREKAGLSITELAKKLEITDDELSEIEKPSLSKKELLNDSEFVMNAIAACMLHK